MAALKQSITQVEFERWREYYQMCPFDDAYRYHRPAALIAAVTVRSDKPLEHWQAIIAPDPKLVRIRTTDGLEDIDDDEIATLAALGFRG